MAQVADRAGGRSRDHREVERRRGRPGVMRRADLEHELGAAGASEPDHVAGLEEPLGGHRVAVDEGAEARVLVAQQVARRPPSRSRRDRATLRCRRAAGGWCRGGRWRTAPATRRPSAGRSRRPRRGEGSLPWHHRRRATQAPAEQRDGDRRSRRSGPRSGRRSCRRGPGRARPARAGRARGARPHCAIGMAAGPACAGAPRSPDRSGSRRSPCRQSRYRSSDTACRESGAATTSPPRAFRLAKYTRRDDSLAGRHSHPHLAGRHGQPDRAERDGLPARADPRPARPGAVRPGMGPGAGGLRLGPGRHLDVPARRLGPRRREPALPVDLRRQRRGSPRPRPLPGLLPAVRRLRRPRADLRQPRSRRCR